MAKKKSVAEKAKTIYKNTASEQAKAYNRRSYQDAQTTSKPSASTKSTAAEGAKKIFEEVWNDRQNRQQAQEDRRQALQTVAQTRRPTLSEDSGKVRAMNRPRLSADSGKVRAMSRPRLSMDSGKVRSAVEKASNSYVDENGYTVVPQKSYEEQNRDLEEQRKQLQAQIDDVQFNQFPKVRRFSDEYNQLFDEYNELLDRRDQLDAQYRNNLASQAYQKKMQEEMRPASEKLADAQAQLDALNKENQDMITQAVLNANGGDPNLWALTRRNQSERRALEQQINLLSSEVEVEKLPDDDKAKLDTIAKNNAIIARMAAEDPTGASYAQLSAETATLENELISKFGENGREKFNNYLQVRDRVRTADEQAALQRELMGRSAEYDQAYMGGIMSGRSPEEAKSIADKYMLDKHGIEDTQNLKKQDNAILAGLSVFNRFAQVGYILDVPAAFNALINNIPVDVNAMEVTNLRQGIDQEAMSRLGGTSTLAKVYSFSANVADNLVRFGLAAGTGNATVGKLFSNSMVGVSVGMTTIREATERGASSVDALTSGLEAAALEIAFESKGIDAILSKSLKKGMLVEGAQEGLTRLFDYAADWIQNGGRSEINQMRLSYMMMGYSEEDANHLALADAAKQIALETFEGALSGGILTGIQNLVGRAMGSQAETSQGETYWSKKLEKDANGRPISVEFPELNKAQSLSDLNKILRNYANMHPDQGSDNASVAKFQKLTQEIQEFKEYFRGNIDTSESMPAESASTQADVLGISTQPNNSNALDALDSDNLESSFEGAAVDDSIGVESETVVPEERTQFRTIEEAEETLEAISDRIAETDTNDPALETLSARYQEVSDIIDDWSGYEQTRNDTRNAGERNVQMDTQESSGRSNGESTEAGEQGSRSNEIRESAQRTTDELQKAGITRGKTSDFLGSIGTDTDGTSVEIPAETWQTLSNSETLQKIYDNAKANGVEVHFVSGLMQVRENGRTIMVDGIQMANGQRYITIDSETKTAAQIDGHEDLHWVLDTTTNSVAERRAAIDRMIETVSANEGFAQFYQDLAEQNYIFNGRDSFYDADGNLDKDLFYYEAEELLANAHGDIDIAAKDRESKASRYTDTVKKAATEQRANARRGPPAEAQKIAKKVESGKMVTNTEETEFSRVFNDKLMEAADKKNEELGFVDKDVMDKADADRRQVKEWLERPGIIENIPEDITGKTILGNGSYGKTYEPTTICPRTLATEGLLDAVSKHLGHPLTVQESIYVAQSAWDYLGSTGECTYCYVAMDRKAKREFRGKYIRQREQIVQWLKDGASVKEAQERYAKEILGRTSGNKTTDARVSRWAKILKNGGKFVTDAMVATDETMSEAVKNNPALADEMNDLAEYCQRASYAKKYIGYTAYNGEILKMKQDLVNKLNSNFGLRMYSFSDYHPAFLLENMQVITDAAVRGLKVLAYTKDIDFARAFEPTHANINISIFAQQNPDADGNFMEDAMQGAEWEQAKAVRAESIKNGTGVGIVMVATNDQQVEWAMAQDWIDVVIPFHMVKTGAEVAKEFGWTNYTQFQEDHKTKAWVKGRNKASITPPMHQNNLQMYKAALEANNLTPRFAKWIDNPNYMKLVNETRRAEGQSPTVQPIFNMVGAKDSIDSIAKGREYYRPVGGSEENLDVIAGDIAEEIRNGAKGAKYKAQQNNAKVDELLGRYKTSRAFDAGALGEYRDGLDDVYDLLSKVESFDLEYEQVVDGLGSLEESIDQVYDELLEENVSEDEIERVKQVAHWLDEAYRDSKVKSDEIIAAIAREEDAKAGKTVDSTGRQLSEQQAEYFAESKIRDEDGNLQVVYHGTDADFTVFDRTKGRSTMDIQGSFFSPWDIDAAGYGPLVNAYYLNITNPAPEGVAYKALNRFKGQNDAGVKAREYLESLGYDGVNNGNEEYIAFNPEQIKLASNPTPTSNPDIRYSRNAIDEEYNEALEADDPDWQRQLVAQAAYEAGYTTGAYHGSSEKNITEFKTRSTEERPQKLQLLFGTHFTRLKSYAELYTKKAKGSKGTSRLTTKQGRVYDVWLDLGKSLDLVNARNYTSGDETFDLYSDLPDAIKKKVPLRTYTEADERNGVGVAGEQYVNTGDIEEALQRMSPKAATELLVSHGYNSVEYTARYYNGMPGVYSKDNSIIMLDPERIKSADPIVRDDSGNIIPLSERFNRDNPDIRYSRDVVNRIADGSISNEEMDEAYMNANSAERQEMVNARAEYLKAEVFAQTDVPTYSIRRGPAPKKTIKVYKVFTMSKSGKPSALFVNSQNDIPIGVWLDAQDTYHFVNKENGRIYVPSTKNPNTKGGATGRSVKTADISETDLKELEKRGYIKRNKKGDLPKTVTALAYRPGWHAGDLPFFPQGGMQIEGSNYENVHRYNQVVFECELAADKDYTTYSTIKSGKNKGMTKFVDRQEMPTDGSYKYATNPMAGAQDIGAWYIGGSLKINRALTEAECNEILEQNGRLSQEWQAFQEKGAEEKAFGPLDLDKLGYDPNETDGGKKLPDAETYDDDGNLIPLSQRFNADIQDPRYSRTIEDDDTAVLRQTIKDLTKTVDTIRKQKEYWKNQTKTSTPSVTQTSANKMATAWIERTGSTMKKAEVAAKIKELGDWLRSGSDDISILEARKRARAVAKDLIDTAETLTNDVEMEAFDDIKGYLKRAMMISPTDASNIPDFEDWRKHHFGQINIRKGTGGLMVDQAYQELAAAHPEYFPEDIAHPADQLLRMADVYDSMEPVFANPYDSDYDAALAAYETAMLEDAITMETTAPTFADQKEAEIERIKQIAADRLQRVRQQRDVMVKKMKQRFSDKLRETKKKNLEKQQISKRRDQIMRHTKDLSNKLLKPTDKAHIPQDLQGAVAKLLESINTSSGTVAKVDDRSKVPAQFILPNGKVDGGKLKKFLENHEVDWAHLGLADTKRTEAFNELLNLYEKMSDSLTIDPDMLGADGYLQAAIGLKDKSIMDMNLQELETVWNAIRGIETTIMTANKTFASSKWERISDATEALYRDLSNREETSNGMISKFMTENLTPEAFFHRLGEAGDEIFHLLRQGQNDYIRIMKEAADVTAKLDVDFKALEKQEMAVKLGGQTVRMNAAQLMNLYVLCMRPQGLQHVLQGGIRPTAWKKGLKTIQTSVATRGITQEELVEAFKMLSEEQKEACRVLQEYVSTDLAKHGNEAAMKVYNYEKFGENNYWPIKSDSNDIKSDVKDSNMINTSVAGKGMAKALIPNADTAVMIGSVFDVFSEHVQDMAAYAAWLAPMEDINRIRNYAYREQTEDENGNVRMARIGSVKELTNKTVAGGASYWQKLMSDLSNGVEAEKQYFGGLAGSFKSAAIGANIRVIIQQPTAIARAYDMISPKYLNPAAAGHALRGWKRALEHSAIAQWKDWGYFDVNTGRTMKSVLFDTDTALDKTKNALSFGAGAADSFAWGILWNACEAETKDLHKDLKPGTEAFYDAVAERFEAIIDHSQVVDGVLQRSQLMRSGDGLKKMATSFMGEPTKQANQFMSAMYDVKHSTGTAKKKAKGKMARTVVAMLLAGLFNSAAQSIIDGFRNKDREKKYGEKWLESFLGITGDEEKFTDYVKEFLLDSNVGDLVNPLTYFPYAKDLWSIFTGYDVERMDMSVVSDTYDSIQRFVKAWGGDSKYTKGNATADLIANAAKLLGVPVSNLKRDLEAGAYRYIQATDNYVWDYHLTSALLTQKNNKKEFIDILWAAREAGDQEAYDIIYQDLLEKDQLATSSQSTEDYIKAQLKKREAEKTKNSQDFASKRDSATRAAESAKGWGDLNDAQQDKIKKEITAWAMDTGSTAGAEYVVKNQPVPENLRDTEAGKIIEGSPSLTAEDYFSYRVALFLADRPTESGKTGTFNQGEIAYALQKASLSDKERRYIWSYYYDKTDYDEYIKSDKYKEWLKGQ